MSKISDSDFALTKSGSKKKLLNGMFSPHTNEFMKILN